MAQLSSLKCVPCEGGMYPLTSHEFEQYLKKVKTWQVIDNKKISKNFKFKDFSKALVFVNKIAEIAEKEGHHPDIFIHNYNQVKVTLSTHAIGGLSTNDFVIAFKIDALV